MGVLSIFNIAQSALASQQVAINVTGQNIANVNTPGYSRQRADLKTAQTDLSSGFPIGSGVAVASVQRSYDSFLQGQITSENSRNGYASSTQTSLNGIETLFNELSSNGLGTSLQDFFKSWQDLANTPQGTVQRQMVIQRGQILADNFHQMSSYVNNLKNDANQSLVGLTSDINDKVKSIAALNTEIKQIELNYGNANELRDQRDSVVSDLAKKVGIRYEEQKDGTLSVSLLSSVMLVDEDRAATLSTAINPGTGMNNIMLQSAGGSTLLDVTSAIGGPDNSLGEIGAALHTRDTLVPSTLGKLDELAYNLATTVNAAHQNGFGLNGTTALNFFSPPAALVFPATFASGYSSQIAMNVSVPEEIAAASADPATVGKGDNTNALAIAGIATQQIASTLGKGTLDNFYNSVVSGIGVDVQKVGQDVTRSNSFISQLSNLRESTSGVSLDEELTKLIQYQKAFQGAAKLVTTASDMLDTLLGLIR